MSSIGFSTIEEIKFSFTKEMRCIDSLKSTRISSFFRNMQFSSCSKIFENDKI